MENALISIIVPVYNVELYLKKSVNSLLNQTYSNIEIILVDDGSTDSSGIICDEFAREDSRVRVIHKTNGGLSDARNVGIDVATGEYLGFVDSDDWIDCNMYKSLYNKIIETQTGMCVCGRYDCIGEKRFDGLCPPNEKVYTAEAFLKILFKVKWWDVSSCDKLFHKSLFEDIRYPVGEIHEDAAIIHHLVRKAERISTLNKRYYNYNHREASITTTIFSEKLLVVLKHSQEMLDYIQKEFPMILSDARAFYGKNLLGLCIAAFPHKEYSALYKKLFEELTLIYGDLYFKDKIKYNLLKYKIFYFVKRCVKMLREILN